MKKNVKIIVVVILLAVVFLAGKYSSRIKITVIPDENKDQHQDVLGASVPVEEDKDEEETAAAAQSAISEDEISLIASLAQGWANTEGALDIYDEEDIADVTTGVILNRQKSEDFPDDIEDIVEGIKAESGLRIATDPSEETLNGVRTAIANNGSYTKDAMFIIPCEVWDNEDPKYFQFSADSAYGNYYILRSEKNSLAGD